MFLSVRSSEKDENSVYVRNVSFPGNTICTCKIFSDLITKEGNRSAFLDDTFTHTHTKGWDHKQVCVFVEAFSTQINTQMLSHMHNFKDILKEGATNFFTYVIFNKI